MSLYTVLSLFSGIGGIDLGLERTGKYETVAYSEVDPYACRIMHRHFPNAVNLGDITAIEWNTVQSVDVIVGGFPCQDISLAGKGAGIHGTRSGLWADYARAIRVLRPRGVIVENVAALLTRGIDRVLRDLAACGYDAEWDCIPAAAVGAPHRRDRLFVIAYRTDTSGFDDNKQRNAVITNADCNRRAQGQHGNVIQADSIQRTNSAGRSSRLSQWNRPAENKHWVIEPNLDRMANGFPYRVDRIRCLGNAVVPQVAEHVGRILLDRIEQQPSSAVDSPA